MSEWVQSSSEGNSFVLLKNKILQWFKQWKRASAIHHHNIICSVYEKSWTYCCLTFKMMRKKDWGKFIKRNLRVKWVKVLIPHRHHTKCFTKIVKNVSRTQKSLKWGHAVWSDAWELKQIMNTLRGYFHIFSSNKISIKLLQNSFENNEKSALRDSLD